MSDLLLDKPFDNVVTLHENKREAYLVNLVLKEDVSGYGEMILSEALGSFEHQKDITKMVLKRLEEYWTYSSKENIVVDVSMLKDSLIKRIIVDYKCTYDLTNASLMNINSDGDAFLEINVNKQSKGINEKEFSQNLYPYVAHELMHANVLLQRYFKGQSLNIPDYYGKSLVMYRNLINTRPIYAEFAFMLYSTYYNERNAFISQVSYEIENKLKLINGTITTETVKSLIKNTNAYKNYSNNIKVADTILNKFTNEDLSGLEKELKSYGINLFPHSIQDVCKWGKEVSKTAIWKIFRNACSMIDYIETHNKEVNKN
jgi:hypothetical protein